MRLPYDASDLDAPRLDVDDEEDEVAGQAASVSTSTVKKSVAAIEPKCAVKKVAQGIRRRREGAGSRP